MEAGAEVGMGIVKHRPTFEILPSKADGYLIVVTWPKGLEQQLDGFASAEAARAWLDKDGQAG